jgi:hypothetical protein
VHVHYVPMRRTATLANGICLFVHANTYTHIYVRLKGFLNRLLFLSTCVLLGFSTGLQKFLNKVAGNPTLIESPRFVKFLTATDKV